MEAMYKFSVISMSPNQKRKVVQQVEKLTGIHCHLDDEFLVLDFKTSESLSPNYLISIGGIIGIIEVQVQMGLI